jgi:hypothetical protein
VVSFIQQLKKITESIIQTLKSKSNLILQQGYNTFGILQTKLNIFHNFLKTDHCAAGQVNETTYHGRQESVEVVDPGQPEVGQLDDPVLGHQQVLRLLGLTL